MWIRMQFLKLPHSFKNTNKISYWWVWLQKLDLNISSVVCFIKFNLINFMWVLQPDCCTNTGEQRIGKLFLIQFPFSIFLIDFGTVSSLKCVSIPVNSLKVNFFPPKICFHFLGLKKKCFVCPPFFMHLAQFRSWMIATFCSEQRRSRFFIYSFTFSS